MAELKSLTYEQARAEHFKALMKKEQRKIDWWQARSKSLVPVSQLSRCHIECSEAGMRYGYYSDALEALENNKFQYETGFVKGFEAAQPKWISVEEALPERHGQKCVGLYSQHGDDKPYPFPFVFTWYAYGDNGYVNGPHFSDEGLDGLKVHYWMPLPEAPKEANNA